jgi:glycosyltransferase involved in cell wall biosynthesis
MRVAYFTDTPEIGGAERYLADLAGLVADGHDVTVVAPQAELLEFVGDTAPSAKLVRASSDHYHGAAGMGGRARELARATPAAVRALLHARPDVVHINNGGYPGSDLCRSAAIGLRAAGTKRVLMTVNSMPWPREHSQPALQTGIDTALWRAVERVLCPSMIVGRGLVDSRGLPEAKLSHVRYGVREPEGAPGAGELRERLAPGGELLVGMVSARPVPEKGYDVFARALAATGPGVRGVLIGPHPGDGFLALVHELGLGERLAIEGRVAAVNAYHHAIDLLVMPSTREEAMPLVMLEAMAAGKPVYASRLSGTPEAVVEGSTGELFEPGDVAALTRLLERAPQQRDDLTAMGRAGRARWEELFSPQAMLDATLAVYADGTR